MLFHFWLFSGDRNCDDVITETNDKSQAIIAALKWAIDRAVPNPLVKVYVIEIGLLNPSGYIRKHYEVLVWGGKEVRDSPHIPDRTEFLRLMAELRGAFESRLQESKERWSKQTEEESKAQAQSRIRVESAFRPFVAELLNSGELYTVRDVVVAARSFALKSVKGIGPEIEAEIADTLVPHL